MSFTTSPRSLKAGSGLSAAPSRSMMPTLSTYLSTVVWSGTSRKMGMRLGVY